MEILLIVLGSLVLIVVVIALVSGPKLRQKGDAAVDRAKELIGGPWVMLEPKVTGLGTIPPEAGGAQGLGCLAVSADRLAFVTWAPQKEFVLERSAITSVDIAAEDVGSAEKSTIIVSFPFEGAEATASFRMKTDLHDWLDELGYDWGPEGRPAADADADVDDDED